MLCWSLLLIALAACAVQAACTVLGLTPLALGLLDRLKRLFLLPRSPLGREPLYPSTMSSPYFTGTLEEEVEEGEIFSCSGENMGPAGWMGEVTLKGRGQLSLSSASSSCMCLLVVAAATSGVDEVVPVESVLLRDTPLSERLTTIHHQPLQPNFPALACLLANKGNLSTNLSTFHTKKSQNGQSYDVFVLAFFLYKVTFPKIHVFFLNASLSVPTAE